MRWRIGLILLGVCAMCCSLASSCGYEDIVLDLRGDVGGWGGSAGTGASDAGADASGGGDQGAGGAAKEPECPAPKQCVTGPTNTSFNAITWELDWFGPVGETPLDCPPDMAPQTATPELYGDLVVTGCGSCTCQPPTGSCALPTTLSAYYTPVCPSPANAPFQSFNVDAPIPWDGKCNTDNSISGVPNCAGSKCIQSLTSDPLVVKDPPACAPAVPPPLESPHWATHARRCLGAKTYGICKNLSTFCAPPVPDGFQLCLEEEQALGNTCPVEFPEKHLLYPGQFTDSRQCSPCSCGAPIGSICEASVSVYKDDCCGCKDPGIVWAHSVESTGPICGDVPSGAALGSKKADAPGYHPGSCSPAGGDLSGNVTPIVDPDAKIVCCLPSKNLP